MLVLVVVLLSFSNWLSYQGGKISAHEAKHKVLSLWLRVAL